MAVGIDVTINPKGAVTGAKTVTKSLSDIDKAADKAQKTTGKFGHVAQQAGYQIGDFAVQVQGGINPMVALSQQGSQLLGIFGPGGAVAGAMLAIGSAIYTGLSQPTQEATESIDSLIGKVDELRQAEKEALATRIEDQISEFDKAATDARSTVKAYEEELRRATAASEDLAENHRILNQVFGPGYQDDIKEYQKTIEQNNALYDTNMRKIEELREQLDRLNGSQKQTKSETDDINRMLLNMGQQLAVASLEAQGLKLEAEQLAAVQRLGASATEQQVEQVLALTAALHNMKSAAQTAAAAEAEHAAKMKAVNNRLEAMRSSLEIAKLQTQGLTLEAKQLAAAQSLGGDAMEWQKQKARELTEALYKQEQAQKTLRETQQLEKQLEREEISRLDPLVQIQIEEDKRLALLEEYRALDVSNEKRYQDLKTAISEEGEKKREAALKAQTQMRYSTTAAGFDALSDLSAAFVNDQDKENSKAFALSKAFAAASASLNFALALSQALADPSALTLPQKIANYAAVATSGAALISTIDSANYAEGGYVHGPGTGTSDNVPANLSNGEFVMPARQTGQFRGALEGMRKGIAPNGSGGTVVNMTVVDNVGVEVSATANDNGDLVMTIDRRIRELTPDIMGEQVANQYSPYSRARKSTYKDTRR